MRTRLSSIAFACALLAGCTSATSTPPTVGGPALQPAVSVSATSTEGLVGSTLPPLRQISRPPGADWLLVHRDISYRDIAVQDLVNLLVPHVPVVYDVGTQPTEPVFSSPQASVDYTVQDHLDVICRQLDWVYEYDRDVLTFSDVETRSFPILAQPGATRSSINSNSLGSTEEGDNGTEIASDPYTTEISALLESMIEPDRGFDPRVDFELLPSTNSVLVTARPSTVSRVAHFIQDYNARTALVARVYVTIFEVQRADRQGIGTELLALNDSQARTEFGFTSRLVDRLGVFAIDFVDEGSRWNGSQLLFEYLNSVGTASIKLQDAVETRNNVVASSSSTRTFQYISSITRNQDLLGRDEIEVAHDTLQTGWSIGVQPTAGLDGVTIRFTLARRTLVEERPYSFGSTAGTTFVTDDFNRSMSVTLQDGETRLLTSLSTSEDNTTKRSMFGFLPTSRSKTQTQVEALLLMRVELI